jgi:dUTP pyrophosphatase
VTLEPGGGRAIVPTRIVIVPSRVRGFVLPRSGLALQHGVTCLNTPGLIDSQYPASSRCC